MRPSFVTNADLNLSTSDAFPDGVLSNIPPERLCLRGPPFNSCSYAPSNPALPVIADSNIALMLTISKILFLKRNINTYGTYLWKYYQLNKHNGVFH